MEKYLNSNFGQASEVDIMNLQKYLNKLGYRNSKGKTLDANGDFSPETQQALKQAKDDLKLYKNLSKTYDILTGNEYNAVISKANSFMYVSDKSKEEFINQLSRNNLDMTSGFNITGLNSNKIFLVPKHENKSYGRISDKEKVTEILSKSGTSINVILFENSYTGASIESRKENDKESCERNLKGLNFKFDITPDELCTNYYYYEQDTVNHVRLSFGLVAYSDDPKIIRISKFEDVKIPPKPKKKEAQIATVENTEKPIEPTKPEIPTQTPSDDTCAKLREEWNKVAALVEELNILNKGDTVKATNAEKQSLRKQIEDFNRKYPENPVEEDLKEIKSPGKTVITHTYKTTLCKQ